VTDLTGKTVLDMVRAIVGGERDLFRLAAFRDRRGEQPLRQTLWRFAGVDLTRIDGISAGSALGACFRRIARRKGASTAVFATARNLARSIYRMLRFGEDFVDEGAQAYDERFRQQRLRSLTTTAKQMGYQLVPVNAEIEVSGQVASATETSWKHVLH
jgi:hypothetical protein